ncbi:MAG: hypothetical protein FJ405_13295, partial [Verrucomicrobia bacterium]|nr:hypothetical protein [Verrucomicrobiota bacterium]
LRQAGQLSAEEIGELDFEAMQSFWGSEVGRQIRGRGEHVQREMPFTLRLGADQVRELIGRKGFPESAEEEFVVVQGQIDLVVECSEELWLVDYKTDRVGPGEATARAEDYRAQLEIYARALEGIFGKPVTRRWVHFLHPGKTVLLASRSD